MTRLARTRCDAGMRPETCTALCCSQKASIPPAFNTQPFGELSLSRGNAPGAFAPPLPPARAVAGDVETLSASPAALLCCSLPVSLTLAVLIGDGVPAFRSLSASVGPSLLAGVCESTSGVNR